MLQDLLVPGEPNRIIMTFPLWVLMGDSLWKWWNCSSDVQHCDHYWHGHTLWREGLPSSHLYNNLSLRIIKEGKLLLVKEIVFKGHLNHHKPTLKSTRMIWLCQNSECTFIKRHYTRGQINQKVGEDICNVKIISLCPEYIKNSYKRLRERQTAHLNMDKKHSHFMEEETEMTSRHMKSVKTAFLI